MAYLYYILIISLVSSTFATNIEYDGWLNIRLQHSFGTDVIFSDRGNVSVQSIRSGGSVLDQNPLTSSELNALKDLSKSDDFYQLKSIVQTSDGIESVFLSSMKAETLLENDLHDCITVWVLHGGAVAAVGITPAIMDTFTENSENGERVNLFPLPIKSPNKFATDVFIRHMEQAPVPDTASYIQKLEREREARDKGEFKDNRSFLAKYWMYIVPVAIFVLLSGAANPEQAATAR